MTETDVAEPPPAPPPVLARFRRGVGFMAGRVGWAAVVLSVLAYAFAYGLPQDFRQTNTAYLLLAAAAFFLRVFQFHAALALGALALLAILSKRWRLAGASIIVGLTLFLPTLSPRLADRLPAGETVRVMSANLYFRNRDIWRIAEEVRRADPDVLVVVEFTPLHAAGLDAAFEGDYPYRALRPAFTSGGIGIYSRLPLRPDPANSQPWCLRATLTVGGPGGPGGRQVLLDAVHLTSPGSLTALTHNRLLTADLLDRFKGESRPAIVAGDFNFNDNTPNFAALLRAGFVSSQEVAGEGRGATWPNRTPLRHLPGVRIDHILTRNPPDGPDPILSATRAWVGGYTGSDHLPIVADIAVR